jgi:hypothetical protein
VSRLWDDLEPALAKMLIDGVRDLAAYLWGKATGTEDKYASLDEIQRRALIAMIEAAQREAAYQAARLELVDAAGVLARSAGTLLLELERAAGSPTVPVLDLNITVVDEMPPDEPGGDA